MGDPQTPISTTAMNTDIGNQGMVRMSLKLLNGRTRDWSMCQLKYAHKAEPIGYTRKFHTELNQEIHKRIGLVKTTLRAILGRQYRESMHAENKEETENKMQSVCTLSSAWANFWRVNVDTDSTQHIRVDYG